MNLGRKILLVLFCSGILFWSSAFILREKCLDRDRASKIFFENKLGEGIFLMLQLNVGQGDGLILISPDKKVTLVDCGPVFRSRLFEWDAGVKVVLPFLRALSIHHIDQMILTHHDQDHIGGAISILKSVSVGRVYNNGRAVFTHNYQDLIEELRTKGLHITALKRSDQLDLGKSLHAQVLSPKGIDGDDILDHNNQSLVLRVAFGNFEMLLTGDVESLSERNLCSIYGGRLHCDFLKVPHHGSKTSSSYPFLRFVQPSVVGISVGRRNSYGHPSPMIIKRYQEITSSCLLRTDLDGAFILMSNGTDCFFATQKGRFEKVNIN